MPRILDLLSARFPVLLIALLVAVPATVRAASGDSSGSSSDDGRIPWFPVLASELKGPYLTADGALFLGSSAGAGTLGYGSELRLGAVWRPVSDFIVGPRAGVSVARAGGETRTDLAFGGEGTLWFVNAVGVGGGADYLLPVSEGAIGRARLESHLRVRMFRLGRLSAAAPRMGVTYDFTQGWGFQAGLHIQFGGVP